MPNMGHEVKYKPVLHETPTLCAAFAYFWIEFLM